LSRAKALRKLGCEIKVIAPVGLIPPACFVFPYPKIKQLWHFFKNTTEMPLEEQTHGFIVSHPKWFQFPDHFCWRYAADGLHMGAGKAIKSVIDDFKPDAVITSWLNPFGTYAKYIKKCRDIPVVAIAEGCDILSYPHKYRGWKRIEGNLNRYCDKIIFVSDNQKKIADEQFNIKSSVVVKNGYDSDLFYFGADWHKKESNKVNLLSVGYLEYVKGHDILLRSLIELGDRYELTLIGSGGLLNQYQRFVSLNGLSHRVNFVGNVEHRDIKNYLDRCDLFCAPSRSESFGIAALEAMACGIPVVATNVGGLPELIIDDFNGYLCEPDNPTSLTNTIKKASQTTWNHMAISEWAKKNYNWSRFAKQIITVLKELTKNDAVVRRRRGRYVKEL
jgi:glycosyltransferase involved in cell wall biosynthesis